MLPTAKSPTLWAPGHLSTTSHALAHLIRFGREMRSRAVGVLQAIVRHCWPRVGPHMWRLLAAVALAYTNLAHVDAAAAAPVRREWKRPPLRPFWPALLTEIYLCGVCSCQETLSRNGRGASERAMRARHLVWVGCPLS
eukprot:COSAG01_NODE_2705_length_7221_cov_80.513760_8_plen_139_part_00